MDAFKIALETVFVGALALPWLALAAQLFFPEFSLAKLSEPKGWLAKVLSLKSESVGYAVVGVLSIAMAYSVGAALSRLAQDFFNDDDLALHLPTEDQIRATVYCEHAANDDSSRCPIIGHGFRRLFGKDESALIDWANDLFSLQENALLLQGDDKVSRLRTLRQQMVVLRGAAFDGLITWIVFLMGWSAKRSSRPWRWPLPIALLVYALYALLVNHLELFTHPHVQFDDPPFMEITLLLLGAVGCYAAREGTAGLWPRGSGWGSLLFAALAYCGWYWTEILYDQQIIYAFHAGQNLKLFP